MNQFELKIVEKTKISPDTFIFKFAIPNDEWLSGLILAKHYKFFMPGKGEGEWEGRMYTPISPITQKGTIDFVIKLYGKTAEFPEGGKMSAYLETKNVGDTVRMEGPMGKITYKGNGEFNIRQVGDRKATKIGLLAGGSGITPLYSLLNGLYLSKDSSIT